MVDTMYEIEVTKRDPTAAEARAYCMDLVLDGRLATEAKIDEQVELLRDWATHYDVTASIAEHGVVRRYSGDVVVEACAPSTHYIRLVSVGHQEIGVHDHGTVEAASVREAVEAWLARERFYDFEA